MPGKLRVTLIKSPISHTRETRATVLALGLHRIGQTIEVVDNDQVRGMTRAVRFLLKTEQIGETAGTETAPSATARAATAPTKTAPTKTAPTKTAPTKKASK